ncbi:MAG: thiamine pyrophosphate-binding protein [Promethearchaeota archaeon]|nr:MAG: thiamine pyrophosphate-binding protein [Candidatus Lokiarchaeota archaeon]
MNGGELLAEVIKKQGVEYIFTLCGGHIAPILVGAKNQGLKVIDVRQEPTAVFAADATARLTGKPGVAVVTAGPGVTNSVTAIKNAQMAQSPLILIGGAVATVLKGKGALQDIEQIQLFNTLVKWSATIEQDCDLIPIMEEAFDVAKSGIPGPVFIECPIDLIYDEPLVREWYGEKSGISKPEGLVDKVIKWYLRRHVDKLFACSPKSEEISFLEGITPFQIDDKHLDEVKEALYQCKKPVLLLGNQVMKRVEFVNQLSIAVEKMGIPTFLSGMARGLLGANHSIYFRHKRSYALRNADLIILAGIPLDFRLNYGRGLKKTAKLIKINRSTETIKKNKKPDMGIQSDPSTYLIELSKIVEDGIISNWNEWNEQLRKLNEKREEEIKEFTKVSTDYINPLTLCERINANLNEKSIIIGDGGDFVATASYLVKPKDPLSWLDPGPYGTLGVGAGFAIAAKLSDPDSEVWLLYGDGAAGYSIIEFDTFVRHNLPVIAVVGNDAGWTQITRDQVEYLNDDVATVLRYNDYHVIAEGCGAKGLLLDNADNIDSVLQEAKNLNKKGHPVLINSIIGKTDFRKGSISM